LELLGYEVRTAADGFEALIELRRGLRARTAIL
jgi:hypothetical protein